MTIIIEKRIVVEHDKLDSGLFNYIFTKINELTLNECTKDHGHILSIIKLIEIKDNYISNVNCDNIFTVVFEAENLKPEIGKVFTGQVCMVFGGGIFLNIKNKQKVLIAQSSLKNYVFDPSTKSFNNNEKKMIKEGDDIDVSITGIKYSKKTFSCFGTMV